MYLKTSLVSALMVSLFSGCGSTTEENSEVQVHEIEKPESVKIERASWDNVPAVTDGFYITNENSTLSFKIESEQIESGESFTEVIFLDTDNDSQTGYNNENWGNVGAEYLIQGNALFSYSGTGWQWDFVTRIDRNTSENLNSDETELEFDIGMIDIGQTLRVTPFLLDEQWAVNQRFNTVSYSLENIVIDNRDEFTISDDEKIITLDLQSQRISNNDFGTEAIFLNTDNDLSTGYNNLVNWHSSLGAEYLIQGNTLFRYGNDGWSWNAVGRVQTISNGEHLTIKIDKENIVNLAQTFSATSYLLDSSWRTVQRFNTLTHTNILKQLPEDHGSIIISHDIHNFNIALTGDLIRDNLNSEIYVDSDQNRSTGLLVNGMGAEYKIINNELFRYITETQTWSFVTDMGISRWNNPHDITTVIPRWRLRVGRSISVSANIADENNNSIYTYSTVNYNVIADDDEITLSLDDEDFYIFTVRSPLIGIDRLGEDGNGEVSSMHIAIDWDNSLSTGFYMNDLGSEVYIDDWGSFHRYIGPRDADWWTKFEQGQAGDVEVNVGIHMVEFRVPREFIPSSNGIIRVAGTLNNSIQGHFYWTNGYEFDLNAK